MSSPMCVTMSPEELIFTFEQGSEESFEEAWSRKFDVYGRTEPKMTSAENTKLQDFTSTNNNALICTPIAPPASHAAFL